MKLDKGSKKSPKKKQSASESKFKFCSIRVGENLFNRVKKHIDNLKKCRDGYSRSQWVNDAIKSKLEKEIQHNTITVDKFLNTRIDVKMIEMMNQQVSIMKKFNNSYSKQKWLVEALSEKLDEEEQSAKQKLQELIVASKKELKKVN